jgi:hypothetical protein
MMPNMMDSAMAGGGGGATPADVVPPMTHKKSRSTGKPGRRQKHKGAKRGHSKRVAKKG